MLFFVTSTYRYGKGERAPLFLVFMTNNSMQEGSIKELWKVSSSLMISFFSMMAMLFIDRLYLANYSQSALTAVASSGSFSWSIILGIASLTSMSEVFVAQYNGAKRFDKLGEPVWQAIWIALFAFVLFIPLGLFLGVYLQGIGIFNEFEESYFRWSMLFAPSYALMTGLTGFFVGQGKTSIVKWLALGGNTINVILDPILIYGVKGYVPSYGIAGAAIATGIGIVFQVCIFLWIFLSKRNATVYNTQNVTFDVSLMAKLLRVGSPPALFVLFELLGWAVFYYMMEMISPVHIVVASVCQSIMMLFLFFGLGLEKGVAAVSGNLLGAGLSSRIGRVVRSGMILNLFFALVIGFIFLVMPDPIINWFFSNPEAIEQVDDFMLLSSQDVNMTKQLVKSGLLIIGIYLSIENIRWVLGGVLTAAGDTFFLMISGATTIWGLMVLPTYFFVYVQKGAIHTAFYIWLFYAVAATLLVYMRYAMGYWKTKQILDEQLQSDEIPTQEG